MSTDQAVRLRAVLEDLEHGRISDTDAARELRSMQWPHVPVKGVGQRMQDSYEHEVPHPIPDGSFHEVARAYTDGKITLRTYEKLADAASDAMRRQHG